MTISEADIINYFKNYYNLFWDFYLSLPSDTRIFVTVLVVIGAFFHLRFNKKTAIYGPSFLTTAGIFCTFLGIAFGLQKFNVHDIAAGIPELLNGLKTAFWASVFGIFFALTLKLRDYSWPAKENPLDPKNTTINDVNRNLGLLLSAIAAPEAESLVSQVKLLRQDMNDKLEKLRISQEKSLEVLAQMGSKALIEALENVIKDFNEKLTTQFGDNFKKLNEAVHKLVEWQEQYKTHIDDTEVAIKNAVESLKISMSVVQQLIEKAKNFSTTAENLSNLISDIDVQISVINSNTNLIKAILEDTAKSIPTIKEKIETFTRTMTTTVSDSANALSDVGQQAAKDIQSVNAEMTKATTELANQIRAQSLALEKEIEKALTTSMTTLGQQLGTLSEQFANDYQPITRSIRELLSAINRGTQ